MAFREISRSDDMRYGHRSFFKLVNLPILLTVSLTLTDNKMDSIKVCTMVLF